MRLVVILTKVVNREKKECWHDEQNVQDSNKNCSWWISSSCYPANCYPANLEIMSTPLMTLVWF